MFDIELRKRLGGFALDARVSVPGGGLVALFGRSGSGKTSLVSAIAGLLRPDAGRVVVDERVLFDSARGIDVPVEQRRVGYVFQDARLFPHLTVRGNLLYGWRRSPPGERRIEFDPVVELLDIGALLERRPARLSGGERQRVAIGRALLAQPRILLMDEPLASLDLPRRLEILPCIERLRDAMRLPIVYVSHSVDEVLRLADAVVLMAEGRVLASGPVEEVMGRADLGALAGAFEGGSVIETRVASVDAAYGTAVLEFSGGRLLALAGDARPGDRVRVRVRARDVVLGVTRPEGISIANILPGRVAAIDQAAEGVSLVTVDIGGATLRARILRQSCERLGLMPGREVFAMVKSLSLDGRAPVRAPAEG